MQSVLDGLQLSIAEAELILCPSIGLICRRASMRVSDNEKICQMIGLSLIGRVRS